MNISHSLAMFAAASIVATASLAAATFEGTLTIAIEAPQITNDITASIKGQKAKITPRVTMKAENGVEGYPILNYEAMKVTMVSMKDKYYLEMPLAQMENTIADLVVKMKKTGKTETILGYSAEEWTLDEKNKDYTISIFATKDIALGLNILISMQRFSPNEGVVLARMAKDIIAKGYCPLRVVVKGTKGDIRLQWHVDKVTPGAIDESAFQVPAGYSRMSDVLKKNKAPRGR